MTEMEQRVAATQKTLDEWQDRPFSWADRSNCGAMAVAHLRNMGAPFPVAKLGTYKTALSARAALKRLGFRNVADAMDSRFARIGWASALVGDVILMPGDDDQAEAGGLGTLAIYLGNQNVLTFHEDTDTAVTARILEAKAAWRVR